MPRLCKAHFMRIWPPSWRNVNGGYRRLPRVRCRVLTSDKPPSLWSWTRRPGWPRAADRPSFPPLPRGTSKPPFSAFARFCWRSRSGQRNEAPLRHLRTGVGCLRRACWCPVQIPGHHARCPLLPWWQSEDEKGNRSPEVQDRYAGDVGDFVKLGLLRALSPGRQLGVAWYRYPDESHNGDGRHITYLDQPHRYEHLDPALFRHLRNITKDARSINSLLPVLEGAISSDESVDSSMISAHERRTWRTAWFKHVMESLSPCDLVFADPDNGIIDDADWRRGRKEFGKQMPLAEVRELAKGRCAVIYHHNTRRRGGHDAEVDHWLGEVGMPGLAVRATAFSPRTFFVLNPSEEIETRIREFCQHWAGLKVRLHGGR